MEIIMKLERIKEIEAAFFKKYPEGFESAEIQAIIKKHKTDKIEAQCRELFTPDAFGTPQKIAEDMTKIVSKSSLVSLFEKPKFRDEVRAMSIEQVDMLSIGLYEMLHGDMSLGYETMVELIATKKLAKWSLVSLFPYSYRRSEEIFIKPTTTKDIIKYFEIEDVVYKPRPSFEFYARYKEIIQQMQSMVDPSLSQDNAGFTGFMMMGMELT
jgi:hypothetical protein